MRRGDFFLKPARGWTWHGVLGGLAGGSVGLYLGFGLHPFITAAVCIVGIFGGTLVADLAWLVGGRAKIPPAVRGIINFVLWIYAGIGVAAVFSVYPAFLPFLALAILLLVYGMRQQGKEDC